ncbi:MAG: UvrB/UvrC motif-containing protein, partial [Chthoniobacterales bacterium]
TKSIRKLLEITEYRRGKQIEYNTKHGITPTSVKRAVQESLHVILKGKQLEQSLVREDAANFDVNELIRELEREMSVAAGNLEYERAALLRDQLRELKEGNGTATPADSTRKSVRYSGSKYGRKSAKPGAVGKK